MTSVSSRWPLWMNLYTVLDEKGVTRIKLRRLLSLMAPDAPGVDVDVHFVVVRAVNRVEVQLGSWSEQLQFNWPVQMATPTWGGCSSTVNAE